MLARVLRLLGTVVERLVVVAAPGQEIPSLGPAVILVRDRSAGRGPLEGIATGLTALPAEAEAAYVTSCDVPLLVPGFVARMFELLESSDVAVPWVEGFHHPLAAVYRRQVLPCVEQLLAADRLRPVRLFELVRTRVVHPDELRDVDPEFDTLQNLNRPDDYRRALARAGFPPV
jgi:molybdopterin-guanine dinucleotide biosynthesis protein A